MQRNLGVELEVVVPGGLHALRRRREARFRAAGLDASVGLAGAEIRWRGSASLPGYASLGRLVERLRQIGACTDEMCGFHVHVGLAVYHGSALPAIGRWLDRADEVRSLFPERAGCRFCRPIGSARDCLRHHSEVSVSRRRPTLEFRLHPGTVLWPEAVSWAAWCAAIVADRLSPIGEEYLDRRRAALAETGIGSPIAWCRDLIEEAERRGMMRTIAEAIDGSKWARH